MKSKHVYMTDETKAQLYLLMESWGCSAAAAIRKAIDNCVTMEKAERHEGEA